MFSTLKKTGFTLVELMVVVSLIGLLSSVVLASLAKARSSSNDTKRVSDMLLIKTALELYYNANNGYPVVSTWQSQCVAWGNGSSGYPADQVIPGLVSGGFIKAFPADPQMNVTANTCCYLYYSNGSSYKLLDHSCPTGGPNANPNPQPQLGDPARDSGATCTSSGVVDGTGPWAWALWSDATSACW